MRDPIRALLNALDREGAGVSIVYCPDLGLRDWLVEQVEGLMPDDVRTIRVSTVEDALREPSRLALLIPQNEREVVLELDGSRDRILGDPPRTQPIVLFLLRDGDGQAALTSKAPSLRRWVSGSDADPEALAEIDVAKERQSFEARHHATPEVWLKQWRTGTLKMTAANFRTAFDASLIEIGEGR